MRIPQLARLTEIRNQLNQYVRQLHEPLDPFQASPRHLMSLAAGIPPATDEDLESAYDPLELQNIPWDQMVGLRESIRVVQEKVRQIGVPSGHPFWGCSLEFFGPDERHQTERALNDAAQLLDDLEGRAKALSYQLGVPTPSSLSAISVLYRCVDVALVAPPLEGVALELSTWKSEESRIRVVIAGLIRYQELFNGSSNSLASAAWEQDWTSARAAIVRRADSFFGRLTGEYRNAHSMVRTYQSSPVQLSPANLKALVQDLFECQELKKGIHQCEGTLTRHFGVQWQGLTTDPSRLSGLLDWVMQLEGQVESGTIPASLLQFFTGGLHTESLKQGSADLSRVESELRGKLETVLSLLRISNKEVSDWNLDELRVRLHGWSQSLPRISEIISWNLLVKDLQGKNLDSVVLLASRWPLAATRLEDHVLRRWAHDGLKRAYVERPAIARFERLHHEEMIGEFRRLDDLILMHNRARVAHAHVAGLPQAGSVGLTAELFRQCELRRGHKAIRWAFERFGELILQIKPVCMMSPLSVAAFLPRNLGMFDIVIFDEASQIKPEDALSAISRAKQIVVVGDSKQMPPTSFFDSLAQDEVDEEVEYDATIGKLESILALCSAAVQMSHRKRDLRWHYRSLHQALIQPSNRLFYEDRLVVFPSPVYATGEAKSELGLRFRYDPTSVYDRGSSRKVNQQQAEEVAKEAIKQITERPQESLMVVAFSKDQQQAIWDAFERLQAAGLLVEYGAKHPFERFNVKNLETVQGDERDVVFISIGYGRDAKGAISMNFGPLNKEGGGRRLNVLMSRARKRIEVFSSIRASDIAVDSARDTGVSALKVFLEFAETGVLEDRSPTGLEPDSDFEIQVRNALQQHGYQVDCQVGTAGFRIDLAVRHPLKPGIYVLGIECDGASYHSAKSARDRDKLRQMVLESRGWRLVRIWSTDWWTDRENTIKRTVSAIEQAREASSETVGQVSEPSAEEPESLEVWTAPSMLVTPTGGPYVAWQRPFQLNGYEIPSLPVDVIGRCVNTIVAFEGPIHEELLIKRIRDSAGKGRAGPKIRDSIRLGIDHSASRREVLRAGPFLYWPNKKEIHARSRGQVDASERRFDWIAPEEIDDAILTTLKSAHSASATEVAEGVKRVFGFGRTVDGLTSAVEGRITVLKNAGLVTEAGGAVSLVN